MARPSAEQAAIDLAASRNRQRAPSGAARPDAILGEGWLPADADLHGPTDAAPGLREFAGSEMALLDKEGVIVWAGSAWRKGMHACQPQVTDGGIGSAYVDLCGWMLSDSGVLALRQGFQELVSRHSIEFVQVYVIEAPDGLRWRQQRIIPSPIGATGFVAIHEDITDLEDARAALRNKPDQLLWAQEQERQRIALELHDSTSQHLVALTLGIRRLRQLARETDGVGDVLEDMTTSVHEAVKEIRVLSYLLKPDALDRIGLTATIQLFVIGFMARSDLETTFSVKGFVDAASRPVQHAALRIVQEALSNAYRHANAGRVDVELLRAGDVLTVRISDNGRGIPRLDSGEPALPSSGVGIASMRSRVANLRGSLNIRSSAGGTVVEARLPL